MSANWLYQPPIPKDLTLVKSYVVFDTETTGLKPQDERLLEISALRVIDGQIAGRFSSLVNPQRDILPFISGLTGIDNRMVSDAPDESVVVPAFMDFAGRDILIGHNVNFDINFINAACIRLGHPKLNNLFIDTLQISRLFLPSLGHHKLEDLVRYFNLTNDSAHRAWSDCLATQQLFECLVRFQIDHQVILTKHKAICQV